MGSGTGGVSGKGGQWTTHPLYNDSKVEKGKTGESGETGKAKSTTLKGDKGDVSVKQQKTDAKKLAKKAAAEGKKLAATQKKAEAKEAKKAAKAEKAVRKEAAKTEKAAKKQQLKEAAAAKKEAKVMEKLGKKLASGKATISLPNVNRTQTKSDPGSVAGNARELAGNLTKVTPKVISAASSIATNGTKADLSGLTSEEKKLADQLQGVLKGGSGAVGELSKMDAKVGADCRKDMLAILNHCSTTQAGMIKEKAAGISTPESYDNFKTSFMRSNNIEDVMFGKMNGMNSFDKAAAEITAEIESNPELSKLLQRANPNVNRYDGPPFTESEKKLLNDFVKKAVSTLTNPDLMDEELAAELGKRHDKIYEGIKEGLKDNKIVPEGEKEALAKQLAKASIYNEISLRWINPSLTDATKGKSPETSSALVALSKAIQTQFNTVSGKTVGPDDIAKLPDMMRKMPAVSVLADITADLTKNVIPESDKMIDRCLELGRK